MTQPDAPSHFIESLWDFFASVRLTVALLLTLAATLHLRHRDPPEPEPRSLCPAITGNGCSGFWISWISSICIIPGGFSCCWSC